MKMKEIGQKWGLVRGGDISLATILDLPMNSITFLFWILFRNKKQCNFIIIISRIWFKIQFSKINKNEKGKKGK